ncbi:MAG: DUF4296 domain-containing protein [Cyanothece sp. SIO1E1]|nr:DUF4296 domain-containing protein [Cyanothece sp. SIO1E1]
MEYLKQITFRTSFLLLIGFGVLACKPEEPKLPIAEDALVPILKDMQLAESIIQQQTFNIQDSLVERYYKVIYKTHDVQKQDIDSTLAILRREPAIMDRVYTKVLEELSKEEVKE